MNVFELFAKINADTSGFEKGLDKAKELGKNVLGGIGNVAKVGFGAATAAVAAGTAAVTAFGVQSVKAYSEYEQLSGGVEKLFGKGSDATKLLMQNAEQAFMTAGMSTNEYMETATSFSASLLKSLDGDAKEAARITDVAMRAMSDNANTFGTDMQSVSNAIMGFSKGNFTMLDNLKLGFAGTKEGMEQLIARANELREANGEMGDLSIESFADMITAVQTVQEDLGVAGTTAREAMNTIEGSANATKAAWQNLITAVGRGEGITDAFGGLQTALFGAADGEGLINQILPRIKTVMNGIGTFIEKSAPVIAEKIPALVDAILPVVVDGGIKVIGAIGTVIPNLLTTVMNVGSQVFEAGVGLMQKLAEGLQSINFGEATQNVINFLKESFQSGAVGDFLSAGLSIVENIVRGIIESAPVLFNAGIDLLHSLTEGIKGNINTVLPAALYTLMEFSGKLRENAGKLADAGIGLLKTLANGIIDNLPTLLRTIPTIVTNIAGIINDNAPKLIAAGIEVIGHLLKGIVDSFPVIVEEFPKIVQAIFAVITAVNWISLGGTIVTGIKNGIVNLAKNIPNALKSIGNGAKDVLKNIDWKSVGSTIIKFIVNGIKSLVHAIPNALKTIATAAINLVKSINWLDLGVKIIAGICNGLKQAGGMIGEALMNAAKDAWEGVKNFFGGKKSEASESEGVSTRAVNTEFKPRSLLSSTDITDSDSLTTVEKGMNYDKLANAVVKAFANADIAIECDDRAFGRLVRKVVTT